MELRLPLHKIKMIWVESQKLLREEVTLACALARLLGKMNMTACVVPPVPLFYCHLQMALSSALERKAHAELRFMGDVANNLLRGAELVGHSDVQME